MPVIDKNTTFWDTGAITVVLESAPCHHSAARRSLECGLRGGRPGDQGNLAIPHPYGRLQFGPDLDLHFQTLMVLAPIQTSPQLS